MDREYRARTFRSGNSLAMRLPKSLGFAEGDEVTIVPHRDGSFSFHKVADTKAAVMALYGGMSTGFMAAGRNQGDQPDRDWSGVVGSAEAA